MRAICCAILVYVFFTLTKSKLEGGIFMDKVDRFFVKLWSLLSYVSIIATIILCCLGL